MRSLPALVFLSLCFGFSTAQLYEGESCRSSGGTKWTCKKIQDCPKAIKLLESGRNPNICSFNQDTPIVCCEPDVSTPTKPRPSAPRPQPNVPRPQPNVPRPKPQNPRPAPARPTSNGRAKEMCKKYAENVFITSSEVGFDDTQQRLDTCSNLDSLITGGEDAKPKEFPHMALIGYGDSKRIAWLCGGSLISRNFILSAAHCTVASRVPAGWARLGEYNLKSKADEAAGYSQPVVYRIIERLNHPAYKAPNSENDIALYKLEGNVQFNEYIRPVCLNTEFIIRQSQPVASGWGRTEAGGKTSDILQKVNLTLVTQKDCTDIYKPHDSTLPRGIREDSMLCAGDKFLERDTCQGDSGGPLQIIHPDLYCMYSQIGITSFGRSCAIVPVVGVYTRVSHFIPWIENIVWP